MFVRLVFSAVATTVSMLCYPVAQAPVVEQAGKLFSPDDSYASLGIDSPNLNLILSPDGRWGMFQTSAGAVVWDTNDNQPYEVERRGLSESWGFSAFSGMSAPVWSPAEPLMAFPMRKDGKIRLSLWDGNASGDYRARSLLKVPNNLELQMPGAWAPDGKTYYFVIDQWLPLAKSVAGDDNDPRQNMNVKVGGTPPYGSIIEADPIEREYPDAHAWIVRSFIMAIDIASGHYGLIAKGNDVIELSVAPDGRHVLVLAKIAPDNRADKAYIEPIKSKKGDPGYVDVYLIETPKAADWIKVDVATLSDRRAGWSDYAKRRLNPILPRAHLNMANPDYFSPNPTLQDSGNNFNPSIVWSPDSSRFAFATVGRQSTGDVYVYELATRKLQNLTESIQLLPSEKTLGYDEHALNIWNSPKFGGFYPPRWLPDGKTLVVTGRGDLWMMSADGATAPHNVSANLPLETLYVLPTLMPASTALVDKEGQLTLVARERLSRHDTLWKLNPMTGVSTKLMDLGVTSYFNVQSDKQGERAFYIGQSEALPANVYSATLRAGSTPQRLTDFRPELASRRMPATRVLEYQTPDGLKGFALLYLPDGTSAEHPAPMVMSAYPGQFQSQLDERALRGQGYVDDAVYSLLVQGIAVIKPDLPLSPWGVYKNPRKQMVDGVIAATTAALATGLIDRKRMGIIGSSHGGYMVQAVLAATDMFKAGVSWAGFADLIGSYTASPAVVGEWSEDGQGRMEDSLWEVRDRYIANTPLFEFDKIRTPLLIMHAEDDLNVPVVESTKSFNALRRLKQPVVFAHYKRGSHAMSPETMRRATLWFREHLLGDKSVVQYAEQGSFFFGGVRPDDKPSEAQQPPAQQDKKQ